MSDYDIKEELYSLLKKINDDILKHEQKSNMKNIKNISTCDSIILITYIKEFLPILMSKKY